MQTTTWTEIADQYTKYVYTATVDGKEVLKYAYEQTEY